LILRDAELGVDSLILPIRTMFDPGAAEGLEALYELRFAEDHLRAVFGDGRLEVERGSAERPDAMIESHPGTLAALIYAGSQLDEALRSAAIKIEARERRWRFLGLFPLPEPAAPAVGAYRRSISRGSLDLLAAPTDRLLWRARQDSNLRPAD
jgi:hypothetical protein